MLTRKAFVCELAGRGVVPPAIADYLFETYTKVFGDLYRGNSLDFGRFTWAYLIAAGKHQPTPYNTQVEHWSVILKAGEAFRIAILEFIAKCPVFALRVQILVDNFDADENDNRREIPRGSQGNAAYDNEAPISVFFDNGGWLFFELSEVGTCLEFLGIEIK